jgi:hypothetical protein
MSHNNDESPNFFINSTQDNTTTENNFQAPNLINPITSSDPGFLINSTDAHILNNLLGANNIFHIPSISNNVNMSRPTTYTTNTITDGNGISSLITISGNIFDDLSEIEEENDDSMPELEENDDSMPELEDSSIEDASGEANPDNHNPFPPPSLTESISSLESLAMRIASRRHRRNSVHPRNIDLMRFFTNVLSEDLEEQIVRQVMRDSFAEDQEKRLIDVARELNIEKEKFDPNKESHKEFCSCRVCLEEYKEGEELGILPCKHFFHYNCIQEWGKRKPNCPYCDVEIPTVDTETESNKKQKLN